MSRLPPDSSPLPGGQAPELGEPESREWPRSLQPWQSGVKRSFDILGAALGLLLTWWVILPIVLMARLDTGQPGLFRQQRAGRFSQPFTILKIRTMRPSAGITTNVTTADDARITRLGRFLRNSKLDELPQLWNVLRGDMSFVGPRPDVFEVYDLQDPDVRTVLSVRPGITGPATLAYRGEEMVLSQVEDAERHNREVIFPDKLRINKRYVQHYRLADDYRYLWRTIFG